VQEVVRDEGKATRDAADPIWPRRGPVRRGRPVLAGTSACLGSAAQRARDSLGIQRDIAQARAILARRVLG